MDGQIVTEPIIHTNNHHRIRPASSHVNGSNTSRRLKMSERVALSDRINRLTRLSSAQKNELMNLKEKYQQLKESSRAHVAATKVQLKQTKLELRQHIQKEMEGALLNPEEARNMLEEREAFQTQIDSLENMVSEANGAECEWSTVVIVIVVFISRFFF